MSVLPPDENLETKEPNGEKDEDENAKEQDEVKDLDTEKDDKSTEDNKDNIENKGPHMDLHKVYRRPPPKKNPDCWDNGSP